MVIFMELEKCCNRKFSTLNPNSIKENNMNSVNLFDTSLRSKKKTINEYNKAVKLKRNFK